MENIVSLPPFKIQKRLCNVSAELAPARKLSLRPLLLSPNSAITATHR
jgi:hypothetical protein